MATQTAPIFRLPMPEVATYKLPVPGERPISVELTARRIYVVSRNGARILDCRRTIECAEEIADQLAAQHLLLEAEALRKEAARWRW